MSEFFHASTKSPPTLRIECCRMEAEELPRGAAATDAVCGACVKRQIQDALIQHGWKLVLGEPPETPGIYTFLFLSWGWCCGYVGQSRNLAKRFVGHRLYYQAMVEFTTKVELWVLECPLNQLNKLERQYIRLLEPRYNGSPSSERAVNRNREINRKINMLMGKIKRSQSLRKIRNLGPTPN